MQDLYKTSLRLLTYCKKYNQPIGKAREIAYRIKTKLKYKKRKREKIIIIALVVEIRVAVLRLSRKQDLYKYEMVLEEKSYKTEEKKKKIYIFKSIL